MRPDGRTRSVSPREALRGRPFFTTEEHTTGYGPERASAHAFPTGKTAETCLHTRLRRAKRAEAPVLSSRKRQSDTASGEKPATAGRKGISEASPSFRAPSLLSDRSIRRRTAGAKPAAMKPSGIPKKTDPRSVAAHAHDAPDARIRNRAAESIGRPVSSLPTRRIYFPAIRSKYFLKKRIW